MNNLKRLFGFLLLAVVCSSLQAERISISMDQDWEFSLGELGADSVFIEQQDWRQLDLPHDWSIEGKYNKYHPSGRGGGYLPTGIAWYRKEFQLPAAYEGRRVFIEFDGVMANSEVYINGHLLGKRPNGYVSFSYDMSDHLRFGGNNQLSVRVNNSIQPASRWYTGSGINRHVRMVLKSPVHLPQWGVFVRSTKVSSAKAELNLQIDVKNDGDESTDVQVVSILRDDQGKEVRKSSTSLKALKAGESSRIDQNLSVQKPRLWSLEDPALYTLEVALYKAKELLDTEIVTTGIRSIRFDPAGGFFLNEKNT
ncbi:MAG: glycoside hydrolase family 2, partial [Bacteroidales bacterium]|nr:glycoside hydrolase family 2 [Bacteroidales bacterium]